VAIIEPGSITSGLDPQAIKLTGEGLLGETFDRANASTVDTNPSGTLWLGGIPLAAGLTLTNICVIVQTAGVGMTHAVCALYGPTFSLLAQTTDVPATWQSTGIKVMPLTAQFTTTQTGLHYIGTWSTFATSTPTFIATTMGASFQGLGAIGSGQRRSAFQTGVAALPNPAVPAGYALMLWNGVS
jgi:hypothetical protein